MVSRVYTTFLRSGSVIDSPCNAVSTENIGVETMQLAEDLIGGYEHLTYVQLDILNYNTGSSVHRWKKSYNHYMKAGTYYTFSSATTFNLPAGNYLASYVIYSDNTNAGTLPLVNEYDSIPKEY